MRHLYIILRYATEFNSQNRQIPETLCAMLVRLYKSFYMKTPLDFSQLGIYNKTTLKEG